MVNSCPNCEYQPLPPKARFCPQCSQPLEIANRVDISQSVGKNYGRVIGVETTSINGDVYGGDIYQVQVYVLSQAGRAAQPAEIFDRGSPPYRFLSPFSARDRLIFFGRDAEITAIQQRIGIARLLVLYGPTGVGKTSLMAAGVIPELIRSGALALSIHDYTQSIGVTIQAALGSVQEQVALSLPQNASLSELLTTLVNQTLGTVILVCDQFEQIFNLPAELRAGQINELIDALQKTPAEYLRLILIVRDDALVRLGDLQTALPDVFQHFMEIKPLTRQHARQAIISPQEHVTKPVYFQEGLVDSLLLPDLDGLTPNLPDQITPIHLQIVCSWLYQKAIDHQPPVIDDQLYLTEARTAAGILARYLEETLVTRLADQRALAEQILIYLASPGTPDRVSVTDIHLNEVSAGAVADVLERLAQAGLLAVYSNGAEPVYALINQTLVEEITEFAGPEMDVRRAAGKELKRVWSAWLANQELATPAQLQRLSNSIGAFAPSPLESLLLIRSSVQNRIDPHPWILSLQNQQGTGLIAKIEQLSRQDGWQPSRSDYDLAGKILFLENLVTDQPASENHHDQYGPVSESAVRGPLAVSRQTAALTLAAAGTATAINRLTWALQDHSQGFMRIRRKGELFGAIREALPELSGDDLPVSIPDRIAIWFWRVQHRLAADLRAIGGFLLGAALGAGIGLAVFRFLTAWILGKTPGLHALMNFIYGAFLALGLVTGLILARYLILSPGLAGDLKETQSPWKVSLFAALLGAVGYTLAYLCISYINGSLDLTGKSLVLVSGGLSGMILALGMELPPHHPFWRKAHPLLILFIIGVLFSLLQLVLISSQGVSASLVIAWPATAYRADLTRFADTWGWKQVMEAFSNWFILFSILDAGITGLLLAAGSLVGLRRAASVTLGS